jgi:hypothetical protein
MDPLAMGPEGDEWYPAFTDENFLTYAPDDAPREVMEEALAIYLNMTPARQKEVLHSVQAHVFGITGLSLRKCATFRWMRLAVAQLRRETADWYTDYCRAVPPRPCLGSIAVHDIRCTTATPFIKDCLAEAILIPHMNHAANVSLDTKRIIT